MKQIIKYAFILVGGFLFMYNILHLDSKVIKEEKYDRSRSRNYYYNTIYYYEEKNIIGASIGFAFFLTGVFIKK